MHCGVGYEDELSVEDDDTVCGEMLGFVSAVVVASI